MELDEGCQNILQIGFCIFVNYADKHFCSTMRSRHSHRKWPFCAVLKPKKREKIIKVLSYVCKRNSLQDSGYFLTVVTLSQS